MPVFAKKLNSAQRRALRKFEEISGFEAMHQEELDTGEMTFREVWALNQQWFDLVASDVNDISTTGCGI
jgi:hypothetical protein